MDEAELVLRAERRAQAAKDAEEDRELALMREWSSVVYSVLADLRANVPRFLEYSEDSLRVEDTKGGKRIGWVLGYWNKTVFSTGYSHYSRGVSLLLTPNGTITVASEIDYPADVSDRELLSLLRTEVGDLSDMVERIRGLYARAKLPEPSSLNAMMGSYAGLRLHWERLGEALGEPPPPAVPEPRASRSRWRKSKRR